jgi:hypothetical protein
MVFEYILTKPTGIHPAVVNAVAYLLKARIVEPEGTSIAREQEGNKV